MTLALRQLGAALLLVFALGSSGCVKSLVMGETRTTTIKGFGVEVSYQRKLEAEPPPLVPIDEAAVEAKAEEAGL